MATKTKEDTKKVKATVKNTSKPKSRKRKAKKKVNSKVMNLFVTNPDSENASNLEIAKLETKYRMDFVERFGVIEIPTVGDFEHWRDSLTSTNTDEVSVG